MRLATNFAEAIKTIEAIGDAVPAADRKDVLIGAMRREIESSYREIAILRAQITIARMQQEISERMPK